MFESIMKFFNKLRKKEEKVVSNSKEAAKERLHLVLMQDRANVSADFLELMKQEIIEVIKKYIDIDEGAIDVRLTNKENEDGTNGAPALYANIPILNIKNEARKVEKQENKKEETGTQEVNDKDKSSEDETKKETKEERQQEEKKESQEKRAEQVSSEIITENKTENQILNKKEENEKQDIDLEDKEKVAEEKQKNS